MGNKVAVEHVFLSCTAVSPWQYHYTNVCHPADRQCGSLQVALTQGHIQTLPIIIIIIIITIIIIIIIIITGSAAQRRLWPPRPRGFVITHDEPQSVGLLWTSDQLVAETLTSHATHKQPCPRWDSNPRSQQASGRRPMPLKARPLGPTDTTNRQQNKIWTRESGMK
jgi:hypothetical protein